MFNKLTLLLVFFTFSLADVSDNKDLDIEYKKALNTFKKGNYSLSYDEFYKLFLLKMDNIKYNFYLGRSAFELKYYEEAQSIFERILLYKPDSTRTKLELARTYYQLNMNKDSIDLFNEIKNQKNLPNEVKEKIDYFLKLNESKSKKHFLSGSFIFGSSFDDNINNDSFNDSFHPTLFKELFGPNGIEAPEKESDITYNQILSLNYKYKENDNLLFKIDSFFYNQIYKENKDKNIQIIGLSPKISKSYNKKLIIDYGIFIDNMWQGKENDLRSYGLNPNVKYIIRKDLLLNASFKYQYKKKQSTENSNEDSKVIKAGLGLLKILNKKLSMYSALEYSREYEKHPFKENNITTNDDINQNILSLNMNLNYKINSLFNITSGFGYSKLRYRDTDSWYLKKRKDKELSFSLGSSYKLYNKSFISLGYNYARNDSNIDYAEYYKNKISFNYILRF